jgi:hypothetical protein
METVVGLMFAGSPFVLTVALLLAAERRQTRQRAQVSRQIALTDALHARLGAVLAPVVRRHQQVWEISVALPADDPAILGALFSTVDEVFGRVAFELRLRRQAPFAAAAQTRRATHAAWESLSWT